MAIHQHPQLDPDEASNEMIGAVLASRAYDERSGNAQAERAERKVKALARRRMETLGLYHPQPFQDAFHRCKAAERVIRGGNQCLAGEQAIYDPVAKAHRRIDQIDEPFNVWTIDEKTGERSIGTAGTPFLKGHDDLYEITLSNGESFRATLGHRVLTSHGWLSVSRIARKQGFGRDLRASNSGICRRASREDGPHSSQTPEGSTGRYLPGCRLCGGRPPSPLAVAQASLQLQDDVLERIHCDLRLGALAFSPAHTRTCRSSDHPSNPDVPLLTLDRGGASGSQIACTLDLPPFRIRQDVGRSVRRLAVRPRTTGAFAQQAIRSFSAAGAQYRRASGGGRPSRRNSQVAPPLQSPTFRTDTAEQPRRGQCLLVPSNAPVVSGGIYITALRYIRQDRFYDFEVLPHHTYELAGIVHHNSGKTTAAAVEFARAVTCQDPHGKYPKTGIAVVIGADQKHIGKTIYPVLFDAGAIRLIRDEATGAWRAFDPSNETEALRIEETIPSPPLIPTRLIKGRIVYENAGDHVFVRVRLKTGWEIWAYSSNSKPPQGFKADVVWIDEDISDIHADEWTDEILARIVAKGGKFFWSALPHSRNKGLQTMSQRAWDDEKAGTAKADVVEFRSRFSANPHLTEDQKRRTIKGWSYSGKDVVRMRDEGEYTLDEWKVFPEFSMSLMGRSPYNIEHTEFVGGRLPAEWCRYAAIDPGYVTAAVLFCAVPPPRPDGSQFVYLEDELYISQCTSDMLAARMASKTMGKSYRAWIIDLHGSARTEAGGKTIRQQYSEAFSKQRVKSETTGYGFILGSDNREARVMECHNWMSLRGDGTCKLRVVEGALPNFEMEIAGYYKKRSGKQTLELPDDRFNAHLMACFDAETQVLSEGGWQAFSALAGTERLATVNLQTDQIEYQVPTGLVRHEHQGGMVRFDGHKLDALVTPDHRMICYRRGSDEPEVKLAADLKITDRLKLHAKWAGTPTPDSPILIKPSRRELEKELNPYDYAEFMGWYISEGWADTKPRCPGAGYCVIVSQIKPYTRAILRALLERLPWHWCETPVGFQASSKQLWSELVGFGGAKQKYVPQWIKDAEPEIIRRFLIGMILGDGWRQRGRSNICTSSKRLADDLQELFIKLGKSASLRVRPPAPYLIRGRSGMGSEMFVISEWIHPTGGLRNSRQMANFRDEQHEGNVYCASVPNGTLIVRRNGKPMVCGNCFQYLAAFRGLRYYRPEPPPKRFRNPTAQRVRDKKRKRRGDEREYVNMGPTNEVKR